MSFILLPEKVEHVKNKNLYSCFQFIIQKKTFMFSKCSYYYLIFVHFRPPGLPTLPNDSACLPPPCSNTWVVEVAARRYDIRQGRMNHPEYTEFTDYAESKKWGGGVQKNFFFQLYNRRSDTSICTKHNQLHTTRTVTARRKSTYLPGKKLKTN